MASAEKTETMQQEENIFNDKLHWYKDAVIYELHIKAFRDSNGDGIGDFKGLLEKIDYLQDLGVTAIWLLPFYPSPLRDDGYDIADYYSIHPSYGNIDEFRQLLHEAHKRNLKVITELVINHTSDQHPWFQRARNAPPDSVERKYYVWSDNPEQYKDVRIIFQDYERSNWTWDPVAQQYYWHRFFHHQPDLNYDLPEVQEEIFRILDYWCEMGVDGFRLDAIPYLFEREGTNGENLPETHAFLKKLRKHVDEKYPGTVLLAEANMWPEDSASYFGDGDECHMNYHFPVMPRMFMSLQMEDQYPLTDIFEQTPEIPPTCQWAIFLRNHDELTLEMVTDEERDYMYKVYAKDPKARINLGIRHRLAPLMENNRRKIELMNSLLFSLPGTPVIYYGDEIGMGDNFYLGDRDGVRTPMQWCPDRNAGFSDTNPQKLYLPIILDPEYHYETVNVENQRRNTSSLFWYMKNMIGVRKKYKAFSRGRLNILKQENPKVLVFTRTYQDETLLVVVNFSKFSQPAEIDLREFSGYVPVEVVSRNKFPAIKQQAPYFFTLSPHSYHWFVLEQVKSERDTGLVKPSLVLQQWDNLLDNRHLEQLENNLLRGYLQDVKWFNPGKRILHSIKVTAHQHLNGTESPVTLILVQATYDRGLPEMYQVPLTFLTSEEAAEIVALSPEALIADLAIGEDHGWLCDAYFVPSFAASLVRRMAGISEDRHADNLHLAGSAELAGFFRHTREIRTKLHASNPGVTAIAFENDFLLKMYRKLDSGANPDIEITRYLCSLPLADTSPGYAGLIEWQLGKDRLQLGMMEKLVENHGNGYTFMAERFNNYLERIIATSAEHPSTTALKGKLWNPAGFEELPDETKILIGSRTAEQAVAFGKKIAQLHLSLANGKSFDLKPEEFSLHYQRSLFSSMQTLVRETVDLLAKQLAVLPENLRQEARQIIELRPELLHHAKQIYTKKLDMLKIRIHGDLHLDHLLVTGKEVLVHDFLGDTTDSYSERRLKRSAVRDLAGIISSLHEVAYEGLFENHLIQQDQRQQYTYAAISWAHYVTGFFMKAYLEATNDALLLPRAKEERKMVLQFFLLRNAMFKLRQYLQERPEWAIIPLRLITSIVTGSRESVLKN